MNTPHSPKEAQAERQSPRQPERVERQNPVADQLIEASPSRRGGEPTETESPDPLALRLPDPHLAFRGGTVESQVATLQRLNGVQRQAMLQQIGRVQGNAHVQRLMRAYRQSQSAPMAGLMVGVMEESSEPDAAPTPEATTRPPAPATPPPEAGQRSLAAPLVASGPTSTVTPASSPSVSPVVHTLVQAKLSVSEPGDEYEQEADQVADQVMRMPGPATPPSDKDAPVGRVERDRWAQGGRRTLPGGGLVVQEGFGQGLVTAREAREPLAKKHALGRKANWCTSGDCRAEAVLLKATTWPGAMGEMPAGLGRRQGKVNRCMTPECAAEAALLKSRVSRLEEPDSAPIVVGEDEERIRSFQGRGEPLPDGERRFFEARMGLDLSQVRVHIDEEAAEVSRSLSARAFTLGGDIVFSEGEYRPGTEEGRRLLAHELTHVVQQGAAKPLEVTTPPGEAIEENQQQAEDAGDDLAADATRAMEGKDAQAEDGKEARNSKARTGRTSDQDLAALSGEALDSPERVQEPAPVEETDDALVQAEEQKQSLEEKLAERAEPLAAAREGLEGASLIEAGRVLAEQKSQVIQVPLPVGMPTLQGVQGTATLPPAEKVVEAIREKEEPTQTVKEAVEDGFHELSSRAPEGRVVPAEEMAAQAGVEPLEGEANLKQNPEYESRNYGQQGQIEDKERPERRENRADAGERPRLDVTRGYRTVELSQQQDAAYVQVGVQAGETEAILNADYGQEMIYPSGEGQEVLDLEENGETGVSASLAAAEEYIKEEMKQEGIAEGESDPDAPCREEWERRLAELEQEEAKWKEEKEAQEKEEDEYEESGKRLASEQRETQAEALALEKREWEQTTERQGLEARQSRLTARRRELERQGKKPGGKDPAVAAQETQIEIEAAQLRQQEARLQITGEQLSEQQERNRARNVDLQEQEAQHGVYGEVLEDRLEQLEEQEAWLEETREALEEEMAAGCHRGEQEGGCGGGVVEAALAADQAALAAQAAALEKERQELEARRALLAERVQYDAAAVMAEAKAENESLLASFASLSAEINAEAQTEIAQMLADAETQSKAILAKAEADAEARQKEGEKDAEEAIRDAEAEAAGLEEGQDPGPILARGRARAQQILATMQQDVDRIIKTGQQEVEKLLRQVEAAVGKRTDEAAADQDELAQETADTSAAIADQASADAIAVVDEGLQELDAEIAASQMRLQEIVNIELPGAARLAEEKGEYRAESVEEPVGPVRRPPGLAALSPDYTDDVSRTGVKPEEPAQEPAKPAGAQYTIYLPLVTPLTATPTPTPTATPTPTPVPPPPPPVTPSTATPTPTPTATPTLTPTPTPTATPAPVTPAAERPPTPQSGTPSAFYQPTATPVATAAYGPAGGPAATPTASGLTMMALPEGQKDTATQAYIQMQGVWTGLTPEQRGMSPANQAALLLASIQNIDVLKPPEPVNPATLQGTSWMQHPAQIREMFSPTRSKEQVEMIAAAVENIAGLPDAVRIEVIRQAAGYDVKEAGDVIGQTTGSAEFQNLHPVKQAEALVEAMHSVPGFDSLPPVEKAQAMAEMVAQMEDVPPAVKNMAAMTMMHGIEGEVTLDLLGAIDTTGESSWPVNQEAVAARQSELERLAAMHKMMAHDFTAQMKGLTREERAKMLYDLNSQIDAGLKSITDFSAMTRQWADLDAMYRGGIAPGARERLSRPDMPGEMAGHLMNVLQTFGVSDPILAADLLSAVMPSRPDLGRGSQLESLSRDLGLVAPEGEAQTILEAIDGLAESSSFDVNAVEVGKDYAWQMTVEGRLPEDQASVLMTDLRAMPEFAGLPPAQQAVAAIRVIENIPNLPRDVRDNMSMAVLEQLEQEAMSRVISETGQNPVDYDIGKMQASVQDIDALRNVHKAVVSASLSYRIDVAHSLRDEMAAQMYARLDDGFVKIQAFVNGAQRVHDMALQEGGSGEGGWARNFADQDSAFDYYSLKQDVPNLLDAARIFGVGGDIRVDTLVVNELNYPDHDPGQGPTRPERSVADEWDIAQATLNGDPIVQQVENLGKAVNELEFGGEEQVMALLRYSADSGKDINEWYRKVYGVDLMTALDEKYGFGDSDRQRVEALLEGNLARADAIAIEQALKDKDEQAIEAIYATVRMEVEMANPLASSAEIDAMVLARSMEIEKAYSRLQLEHDALARGVSKEDLDKEIFEAEMQSYRQIEHAYNQQILGRLAGAQGWSEAELQQKVLENAAWIEVGYNDLLLAHKARSEGWTAEQLQKARDEGNPALIDAIYEGGVEGLPGGVMADLPLQRAFASRLSGAELDLVKGWANNDMTAVDAARIRLSTESKWPWDKENDAVIESLRDPYRRAQADVYRDEVAKLREQGLTGYELMERAAQIQQALNTPGSELYKQVEARAGQNMTALEDVYKQKYAKTLKDTLNEDMLDIPPTQIGDTELFDLGTAWTRDRREMALELLEGKGHLSPEQEIHYAIAGWGTDADVLYQVVMAEDTESLKAAYSARYGKSLTEDLSGLSDWDEYGFEIDYILKNGVPKTFAQKLAFLEERVNHYTDKGGLAQGFAQDEAKVLRHTYQEAALVYQEYQKVYSASPGSPEVQVLKDRLDQLIADASGDILQYRYRVDDVTNKAVTAVTLTLLAATVLLTAGPGVGLISTFAHGSTAAELALSGAMYASSPLAAMMTKVAMKGGHYFDWNNDEFRADLLSLPVDVMMGYATSGIGDDLVKTKWLAGLADEGGAWRLAAYAIAEGGENLAQEQLGALVRTMAADETWTQGNFLRNIAAAQGMQSLQSLTMGAVLGGPMRAVHMGAMDVPGWVASDDGRVARTSWMGGEMPDGSKISTTYKADTALTHTVVSPDGRVTTEVLTTDGRLLVIDQSDGQVKINSVGDEAVSLADFVVRDGSVLIYNKNGTVTTIRPDGVRMDDMAIMLETGRTGLGIDSPVRGVSMISGPDGVKTTVDIAGDIRGEFGDDGVFRIDQEGVRVQTDSDGSFTYYDGNGHVIARQGADGVVNVPGADGGVTRIGPDGQVMQIKIGAGDEPTRIIHPNGVEETVPPLKVEFGNESVDKAWQARLKAIEEMPLTDPIARLQAMESMRKDMLVAEIIMRDEAYAGNCTPEQLQADVERIKTLYGDKVEAWLESPDATRRSLVEHDLGVDIERFMALDEGRRVMVDRYPEALALRPDLRQRFFDGSLSPEQVARLESDLTIAQAFRSDLEGEHKALFDQLFNPNMTVDQRRAISVDLLGKIAPDLKALVGPEGDFELVGKWLQGSLKSRFGFGDETLDAYTGLATHLDNITNSDNPLEALAKYRNASGDIALKMRDFNPSLNSELGQAFIKVTGLNEEDVDWIQATVADLRDPTRDWDTVINDMYELAPPGSAAAENFKQKFLIPYQNATPEMKLYMRDAFLQGGLLPQHAQGLKMMSETLGMTFAFRQTDPTAGMWSLLDVPGKPGHYGFGDQVVQVGAMDAGVYTEVMTKLRSQHPDWSDEQILQAISGQMGGSRITSIKSGVFAGLIYNQGMGTLGLPTLVRSDYDAAVFIDKDGNILNDAQAKQLTYFVDGAMTGRIKKPFDAAGYARLNEAILTGDMAEIKKIRQEYLVCNAKGEYVREEVLHSTHGTYLDPNTGRPVINPKTGQPLMDPETGAIVIDPATGKPILGHPGNEFVVGPRGYTYIDESQLGSWSEQQGLSWYRKWEAEIPTQPWDVGEQEFDSQAGSTLTYRTYYYNGEPRTYIIRPDGTTIAATDVLQLVKPKGGKFILDASNMPEAYRIVGQPEALDPWGAAREAYAAQLAAEQITDGEIYLGQEADRFINGTVNQQKAADVVAVNSYGQYRLFEAKGRQIENGLTQLRLSANRLGPEQVIRYDLVVGSELEKGYSVTHDNYLTEVDAQGKHTLVLINGKPVKVHFTNTLSEGK